MIEHYPGCMLAETYTEWPGKVERLYAEAKHDGYRLSALIRNGRVEYYCRKPKPVTWNLAHITNEILDLGFDDCFLDGEVCGQGWGGTAKVKLKAPTAEDEELIKKNIKFFAFDFVPLKDIVHYENTRTRKQLYCSPTPLRDRRAQLDEYLVGAQLARIVMTTPSVDVHNHEEAMAAVDTYVGYGFEGAIFKHPTSSYLFAPEKGPRAKTWLKYKLQDTMDVKVVEVIEGNGKYAGTFGTFLCVTDDGTEISVGGGKGVTDEKRHAWWEQRAELPGRWMEIVKQAGDVATARHPRFFRWREEKNGD